MLKKNDKVLAICKHCKQGDIRRISLEGLEKRFEKELKISDAATSDKIIAAMTSLLQAKVADDDKKERCRKLFIQACRQCEPILDSSETAQDQVCLLYTSPSPRD